MVQFESALERDCIAFFAGHRGFIGIKSQPTTVTFAYAGRIRRYTPDFLVAFEDVPENLAALGFAPQTYVEVKYAEQAVVDRNIIAARLQGLRQVTGRPAVLLDESIIRCGGRK